MGRSPLQRHRSMQIQDQVAVAGLTKRFLNHIQKDFFINVWGYRKFGRGVPEVRRGAGSLAVQNFQGIHSTVILSIAVGAVIAMNFCNYGCLNYRRSLGEALIIDGLKLKNRTNKFRKNPDEQIPKKSGRKKSEQNFRRKIKTTKKWSRIWPTDCSFVISNDHASKQKKETEREREREREQKKRENKEDKMEPFLLSFLEVFSYRNQTNSIRVM